MPTISWFSRPAKGCRKADRGLKSSVSWSVISGLLVAGDLGMHRQPVALDLNAVQRRSADNVDRLQGFGRPTCAVAQQGQGGG
jgi:hypothetical protein